ncbi:MAG: nucleotidyltransferase domain-containing protein, partial [Sphingobacteriales bacterium]
MEKIIKERLIEIATDNQLKILYSLESGSRGWQFASPDSDYDVRFIYIKPLNYYLSVANHPDQISFAITDELDIYGWDLRKVLQLIRKSNTTPFEWLQSPIIYEDVPGFRDELW